MSRATETHHTIVNVVQRDIFIYDALKQRDLLTTDKDLMVTELNITVTGELSELDLAVLKTLIRINNVSHVRLVD